MMRWGGCSSVLAEATLSLSSGKNVSGSATDITANAIASIWPTLVPELAESLR
jgi:hypothetical protein